MKLDGRFEAESGPSSWANVHSHQYWSFGSSENAGSERQLTARSGRYEVALDQASKGACDMQAPL